jgi:uncharacterized protein DUF5985
MATFKVVLFLIAALTSLACMVLLFRAYIQTRVSILLWSALCFVGQTVNSIALFVDLVVLPDADLRMIRLSAALIGMLFLLYGFIREGH